MWEKGLRYIGHCLFVTSSVLVQIAANEDARFVIRTLVFDDQRNSRVPRVSRILALVYGNKNCVGISRGNFSEKKHPHIETFRYL